jgi:uncharacterized protein
MTRPVPPVDERGLEHRTVAFGANLVRAKAAGGTIGFRGHAAVFSTRTWIGPPKFGFWEQVAPGSFASTLTTGDARMLVNHDTSQPLARVSAGNLRLSEDVEGLAVDADMAPTSYAKDVAVLLEAKVLREMSFGFTVARDSWKVLPDGTDQRTLLEVDLLEVSVVTFPAYVTTDAALRTTAEAAADDARRRRFAALGKRLALTAKAS